MTTVSYHIQERSVVAGIEFPWRTIPIGWSTEDAARAALNHDDVEDDDRQYRIVRVTTEVLPRPAETIESHSE